MRLRPGATNSDGDAPPELPERLSNVLLVTGEEITMALDVHVNALGLSRVIRPPRPPADLVPADQSRRLLERALGTAAAQGALATHQSPRYRCRPSARPRR